MDESNWWLYLIGAAVAYYFVPWGAVLKWLAVAICVGIAFAFFTDNSHSAQYRLIGGLFFSVFAVLIARSRYRETVNAPSGKNKRNKSGERVREPCFNCNGRGEKVCGCLRVEKDMLGWRCMDCHNTKYVRCNICGGKGWRYS